MANPEHVEIVKQGAEAIKEWRENNPDKRLDLSEANLWQANLSGANLFDADLNKADLRGANLIRADLSGADLSGAHLIRANLSEADLRYIIISGETLLLPRKVSEKSRFTGVALDVARIDPGILQVLQYVQRRQSWEEWYGEHKFSKYFVALFWLVSNYGTSTRRIMGWFVALSIAFAYLYCVIGFYDPPGIIENLFEIQDSNGKILETIGPLNATLRSIYFSIVTMTTLGFGDMHAARNILAYCLVTLHVIFGYALLGALITRFAILFTSGGPMQKINSPGSVLQEEQTPWGHFRQMPKDDWKAWRKKRAESKKKKGNQAESESEN